MNVEDICRRASEAGVEVQRLSTDKKKQVLQTDSMLDRLRLSQYRVQGMAEGLKEVSALPDPCGSGTQSRRRRLLYWNRAY